ncbi:hypothetical protein B0H11DRAFT_1930566 [Mycena galericulata]|nr:hypothetical protein B0H11DRAFT_1930566 [Mycena galericulata]
MGAAKNRFPSPIFRRLHFVFFGILVMMYMTRYGWALHGVKEVGLGKRGASKSECIVVCWEMGDVGDEGNNIYRAWCTVHGCQDAGSTAGTWGWETGAVNAVAMSPVGAVQGVQPPQMNGAYSSAAKRVRLPAPESKELRMGQWKDMDGFESAALSLGQVVWYSAADAGWTHGAWNIDRGGCAGFMNPPRSGWVRSMRGARILSARTAAAEISGCRTMPEDPGRCHTMPKDAVPCRAAAGAGGIWAAIRQRELFSQTNSTTRRRTPDDATGTVGGLFFGFNSVILGRIRRERAYIDPMDAAEAYFNLRPYLEKPGLVYVHMRRNAAMFGSIPTRPAGEEVDWVDVKPGRATDLAARRESYADKCVGVELAWQYCYETKYSVLLERLVHLTLTARGAKRQPEECEGCGVWHREYFGEGAAGGLDGVAGIIEYWMRRLGEVPVQVPLYN